MASITPRKRKAVDFSEPTIAVTVSESQKVFTMHPSMLANSKFFRSALSGAWKESKSKSITLPETGVQVFQSYAAYVYTGEIDICAEPIDEANDPEGRHRFYLLAELYVLADVTVDDKTLRNAVVDAVLDIEGRTGYLPSFRAIKHTYDNSSGTSTMCNLLLDNALAGTHPDWLKSVWNSLPTEYLQSLVYGWAQASFDKKLIYKSSSKQARCKYHEHDEDVPSDGSCGSMQQANRVEEFDSLPPAKKKVVVSPRARRSRA